MHLFQQVVSADEGMRQRQAMRLHRVARPVVKIPDLAVVKIRDRFVRHVGK